VVTDSRPPDGWLVPAPPQTLEGTDAFADLDATVVDFWRWAFSDLRDNTVRGVLAEFLVATALGRTAVRRKGWDNYDVLSGSGVRVEVKASGYLQSWARAKHSRLDFGRVAARSWDENTNELSAKPEVRADVFVFAVQTCRDPAEYNALDISQWEFYVVPAEHVRACGYKSVTISWVRRCAEPVDFARLADAIEAASRASSSWSPDTK
jgi:hypothetical protein